MNKRGLGKWIGIAAAAVLLLAVVLLGVKQGWFAGKEPDVVTMEDMKDASWEQLTDLEKKRIETLLKEADNLFITDRLVEPKGNNAYELYRKVLEIHPSNKYALAQLDLIRKDFLKRGNLKFDNGNYDEALNIAAAGLSYFTGDSELLRLQKQSKIRILEARARQLAQKKQYISPEKNNAYAVCQQILQLDASNAVARQVLSEIENWFAVRGRKAEQQKNWTQVKNVYKEALNYFANNTEFKQRLRTAQARILKQKAAAEAEWKKRLGIEWIWVPGGTFEMGDTFGDGSNDEKPVHTVTVDGFYMSKYEVTFAQYDKFCEATGRKKPSDSGWGRGNRPVINVSWYDAVEFCNWLSKRMGLQPCYKIYKNRVDINNKNKYDKKKWLVICDFNANGVRLPTEAEWGYAAREGGKRVRFGNGKNIADPSEINFDGRSKKYDYAHTGIYRKQTTRVGSFNPNKLGLYDMSGNVWEWCWDWYSNDYYKDSPQDNPKGPDSGSHRVLRGGSWGGSADGVRVADRGFDYPGDAYGNGGFRLVRIR